MAPVVDVSSPARVTGSTTDGTVAVTTASFSPPASVLVACVQANARPTGASGAITNNGTALTWSLVAERSVSDSGGSTGYAGIFVAVLSASRVGMTVTATITSATSPTEINSPSIKLYVVNAADMVNPVGGSAEGSSTTNNLTTTGFNSSRNDSLGFASGCEWNALGSPTSADCTVDSFTNTSISGTSGFKILGASGSSSTFNLDAGSTTAAVWDWVTVEIQGPQQTSSGRQPPMRPLAARWAGWDAGGGKRHLMGPLGPLSGGQLDHVPGQGDSLGAPVAGWGLSPWGTSPWGWGDEQITIPQLVAPRRKDRSEIRVFTLARRGRFFPTRMVGRAPGQIDTPPFIRQSKRQVFALARRGAFGRFPIVGRAPGQIDTPAWISNKRVTRVFALARRGEYYQVPIPAPFVAPPRTRQTRRPQLPTRRGQFSPVRMVGFAPGQRDTPPFIRQSKRQVFTLARRGTFGRFPIVGFAPGQLDTPPFLRQTRRPQLPVRRGEFAPFPLSTVVVSTQHDAPDRIKSPRTARVFALARRGQFSRFPLAGINAPDRIKSRAARVFALARRGQFGRFPLVGRAPGQLDTPPFIRQTRRPQLPSRGWKRWGPSIIGLAPGQFVAPDRIDSQRPRIYTARRGQVYGAPLEPWRPSPAFRGQAQRRNVLARRGEFQVIPPAVVVPPGTQAKPPDAIVPANRRRNFALPRRGRIVFFPLVGSGLGYQTAWIPSMRSPRVRQLTLRRSHEWVPVAPPASVWTPSMRSQRVRQLALRRGRQWVPVPTPPPPAWVPSMRSQRVRQLALRRSHQWVPVPPLGTVPDRVGRPRVRQLSVRRSTRWAPVPTYGPPPARIIRSGSRPGTLTPRRRRFFDVRPTAPTGPPSRVISRRPRGSVARRGRFLYYPVGSFVGLPVNYVINSVGHPLLVDVTPAAVRVALAGLAVELQTNPAALSLALAGDPVVIELHANGTATFPRQLGAKTILVKRI